MSTLIPFVKFNIGKIEDTNSMQNAITNSVNSILNKPILDGELLKNIPLQASNNVIPHKLGKPLLGFIIVAKNNNASIYGPLESNNKNFTIYSDSNCIVSMWVF